MKESKKKWIIASAVCVLIGGFIVFGAAAAVDFDFTAFNSENTYEKTYAVSEGFENINIETAESDINFIISDGVCKVVCTESDKVSYSVSADGATLNIIMEDNRRWYEHISFMYGYDNWEITVYLPKSEYKKLKAKSSGGDISVSDDFAFEVLELGCTSGDIEAYSDVSDTVTVSTSSGNICISGQSANLIKLNTTSGGIELNDVYARSAELKSTSGNIEIERTEASENIKINTTSGAVSLLSCDSENIEIKTTGGNVSGYLMSEKDFTVNTSSGDIDLPDGSSSRQKCIVSTSSGDIRFRIKEN